jgi:hypothetical protein
MKKSFFNLFKSKYKAHTKPCTNHNIKMYPNIIANEFCKTCNDHVCYICSNKHLDNFCEIEWGSAVIENLKQPNSDKNIKFNLGYPFIIDLNDLNCSCGKPFLESDKSAICAACGTATCSPECHKTHVSDKNECLFKNNFLDKDSENLQGPVQDIEGLRTLKLIDFLKAIEFKFPPFTKNSFSSSKFLVSYTGPEPFTVIVQRGFKQYGQPQDNTLNAMKEYDGENKDDLFQSLTTRLCDCDCEYCFNKSPHPVYNCYNSCKNIEELTEDQKLKYKVYSKCHCSCNSCFNIGNHTRDDCIKSCVKHNIHRH